jgi:GNAT superfamily N-acetyltransferase
VSDVGVGRGSVDEVRAIQVRRCLDAAAVRASLELAEAGSAWVARDQSEIVGVAIGRASNEELFAGDVFVEASYRGQGVGRALLGAAFGEGGDTFRSMLTDPADPSSLALAALYGLSLQTPVLRLAGAIPKEEELARMAAGDYRFEVDAVDALRHGFALDALDRETRGATRPGEHAAFAREATGNLFLLNGEAVAYSYVWPDGRIGPIAASSAAYLLQLFAYALVTIQRAHGASWCTLWVPGTNLRVLRAALHAGLRIEESLAIASDAVMPDLSRYVGAHRIIF